MIKWESYLSPPPKGLTTHKRSLYFAYGYIIIIHEPVKNALIKDGWTIRHDLFEASERKEKCWLFEVFVRMDG